MQSGGLRTPSPCMCEEELGTSSELGPGRQMNQSQPLASRLQGQDMLASRWK